MADDELTRMAASLLRAVASKQIEQRGDATTQTADYQIELGESNPAGNTPNADPRFIAAQQALHDAWWAEFGTTNPGL